MEFANVILNIFIEGFCHQQSVALISLTETGFFNSIQIDFHYEDYERIEP